MTRTFKTPGARWSGFRAHIREFGRAEGVVEGLADFGTQQGPEVDVRWSNGLRYAYHPDRLTRA